MTTLNEKLGKTFHLSLLRKKLIRLGLPKVRDWETLAIQRGCSHYQNYSCEVDDPGEQLSNEELGLALLLGENPYNPRSVRIAVQLLSGPIDLQTVILIAERERLLPLLNHLASEVLRYEPDDRAWKFIKAKTPKSDFPSGVLPHHSRFVLDQGTFVSPEKRFHVLRPIKEHSRSPSQQT